MEGRWAGRKGTYRFGAIESNSSKNNTHGLAAEARSKRSRTWPSHHNTARGRLDQPLVDLQLSYSVCIRLRGRTHALFTRPDVLVQDLWALDADKVETALLGDSRGEERLATPGIAVQEQTDRRCSFVGRVERQSEVRGQMAQRELRRRTRVCVCQLTLIASATATA